MTGQDLASPVERLRAPAPASAAEAGRSALRAQIEALPRFAVDGDRRGRMLQRPHGGYLYLADVLTLLAQDERQARE